MNTSHPPKNWYNASNHPGAIFIQLTTACNARCINCPHLFTYGSKGYHTKGIMTDDVWNKFIRDIQTMGYRNQVGLYLHHEPLLSKTLFKKIKQVNEKTEAFVVISTNGLLLNEKNRKALIEAKPQIVHININSAEKDQYEKMTGLNFDTTIGNAKRFIAEAAGKLKVEINCPVLPEVDIKKLIQLFPNVQVNTEHWANSRGGLLEEITSKGRGSRFKISEYCLQPEQNFNILFDGSVVLCCLDWAHESKKDFPNIMDKSIQEIYQGEIMKRIIEEFRNSDYNRYKMCRRCAVEMNFIEESDNTSEPTLPIKSKKNHQRKNEKQLSVLLATNHLFTYTGSEITLITIAKKLKEKGHNVSVYAKYIDSHFIHVFNKIAPVFNDVRELSRYQFNAAYIQHNTIALEIRYQYPNLPILFASLGVLPFLEQPPMMDLDIYKHLAISEEVKDKLIHKGIDVSSIEIFRNIVDSNKFKPMRTINPKPLTAIVYSYKISPENLNVVQKACEALNIQCRHIGEGPGVIDQNNVTEELNEADIVFTLGRGVIETMMCGKIPIVYDYQGGDGMVTPENIHELMSHNFSGRRYGRQYQITEMIDEIKGYNPENAAKLRELSVDLFDADKGVNQLISWLKNSTTKPIISATTERREKIRTLVELINITKEYSVEASNRALIARNDAVLKTGEGSRHEVRPPDAINTRSGVSPRVSIIIPLFNNLEFTKQCLEALIENTPDELYEVIIVDNASTDGTHEFLVSLEGDVTVITNETNLGFAKACNQGAQAASGKYLVFLNNDTIPHPGWLTELVKTADEHEDIGIVGSKLLFPNGTIQHAGVVIVETPSGKLGNHIYWGFPGNFKQANIARDFQVVTAACMLISRDLFFSADGFDERYINGMEDVDLCFKIRNLGKRVFYCPTSVLTHFESKTPGRFDKVSENEKLFIRLWDDKIEADINKYLIKDGYRIEHTDGKASWKYHEELFHKLLTVIIHTRNSLTMLKRMIENIMLCTSLPVEIIIVDKNSSDGTKEYLKKLHEIHIVNMQEKAGAAECFIAGLEKAKGDYIAFLNPEVVLTTDWDTQFILKFKKNTGAVSTFIYSYEDLMNYKSLMRNPSTGKTDLDYFASVFARWNQNKSEDKGYLDPRCFMLKRDTIDRLGMFNGDRSKNTLELDCLMQMKKAGYEVVRSTGALVYIKQYPDSSLKQEKRDDDTLCKNDPAQMDYITKVHENTCAYSSNTSRAEYEGNITQLIGIPLTSIIILTFNQLKFTKECLNSILEHTKIPYELILVDNGSTDGTAKYLNEFAENHNGVQLILNNRNLGFASGNNQGLEKAKGKYILLLNNDVVVTKHWLGRLISHSDTYPNIGMVGPMSNSVSGPQRVDRVPYGKNMKAMQRFAVDFAAKNNGKSSEILRVVGFCLLIKRQVLDIIGGLDENYGNGNYEDDDLCLRARIAGFRNIIAHDVFIHHYGSMTFKGNKIDYTDSLEGNRRRFADKWKDIIEVNGSEYRIRMTKEDQLKKLLEWGEERFSQGNFNAAVKIFERVLKLDKANSQAMNNLGVIQWQIGKELAPAMKTFQTALVLNPKDSDALENLVQAAMESSRFDLINPVLLNTVKKAQPANPDLVTLINAQQNSAMTA